MDHPSERNETSTHSYDEERNEDNNNTVDYKGKHVCLFDWSNERRNGLPGGEYTPYIGMLGDPRDDSRNFRGWNRAWVWYLSKFRLV